MTLGERCLATARQELAAGAYAAPYGQTNTSKWVEKYLAGCVRNDKLLGLKAGNWCAAFASWCLERSIRPGEERPHAYRAGVVEIVADAKKLGRWFPWQTLQEGFVPTPGDLAIWDRSDLNKPNTSWWRHVNRVIEYDPNLPMTVEDDRFQAIGGNEGRRVRVSNRRPKRLGKGRLLGFVSYAQAYKVTDQEREQVMGIVALNNAQMAEEATRHDDAESVEVKLS